MTPFVAPGPATLQFPQARSPDFPDLPHGPRRSFERARRAAGKGAKSEGESIKNGPMIMRGAVRLLLNIDNTGGCKLDRSMVMAVFFYSDAEYTQHCPEILTSPQ